EGLQVQFLGQLPASEVHSQIAGAKLQILPSEWFETFGLAIVEAFAHGTPAAVSKIGPLPSIVSHDVNGIVFEPANPQSLLKEVRRAWEAPLLLERLGHHARLEFEKKYTDDANYSRMLDIYERALRA